MEKMTCEICGKVMEGFTIKQVNWFLNAHIVAKHNDKINKEEENVRNEKVRRKKSIRKT